MGNMEQHPDPVCERGAVGDHAVLAVEAEMMCRRCGHVQERHVGCGRDCPTCGGEESCLDCMDADPHGDTDLHFFEPMEESHP